MKYKVAITTTSFAQYDPEPVSLLEKVKYELRINKLSRKLDKKETLELCRGCIGIIAGTELYDRDILRSLAGLKVISRCGVGLENIDLQAARELGIKVTNTPTGPTLAVAELTIGLIFDLLRNISRVDREIRKGVWKKHMGNLLQGKNVGIVGFGRIGQKVAELLVPFAANIAYFDISPISTQPLFIKKDFLDLLSWADIITLHCSSVETKKIIGKDQLRQMKKGALLINAARGEFLDEDAVYEALKAGKLAGLALDTFNEEPYTGRLRELDNVVFTPHIGSYAKESRIEMEIQAVNNLLENLEVNL